MPRETKVSAKRRSSYRSRVFIGGSYHQEARDRLDNIKSAVKRAGYQPVVADEVQLENAEDIHHETMVLLHSCRLAIFELSQLSGALMEIERLPDYGAKSLILYADPDNRGWLISRMLTTFVYQHQSLIQARGYVRLETMQEYIATWLEEMRKGGLG